MLNRFCSITEGVLQRVHLIQPRFSTIGFDAYIDTDSIEGIDIVYQDYKAKGVKIISEPQVTEYGSYKFVLQDIDGRNIGIGLIADKKKYFENSNYLDQF